MKTPRELLAVLQAYRKPAALHPIADRSYLMFEAGGGEIRAQDVCILRSMLDEMKSEERWVEFLDALVGLYSFVIYANQKLDAPEAARTITALLSEQREFFGALGDRLAEAPMDGSAELRDRTRNWWGESAADRRAPRVGDPAPEGTIRASTLKPRARRPEPSRPRATKVG